MPEITLSPENFVIPVDQFGEVTINCSAAGIPVTEISWIREANGVNSSINTNDLITIADPIIETVLENGNVLFIRVISSLTFNSALDENSGRYFCIASNTAGQNSTDFQLLVRGENL